MNELKIPETSRFLPGPLLAESISVLHGANYFSGEKVIRFRINLGPYDEVYTNTIPGFSDTLKKMVPTLYQHHCSLKKPGGFFERVKEGTLLGHVVEHVAIELQTLAGMDVGFGKTRAAKVKGVYNIVFRFFDEMAGRYAGTASVNLVNSILQNISFNVDAVIENLIAIREVRMPGFSTQAIIDEAEKRGIPWLRLDEYNLVQLGSGKYRKMIQATISGDTSLVAVELADNKFKTNNILNEYGVPVPESTLTSSVEGALDFTRKLNKPVVVKPSTGGYQGKRVGVNLTSDEMVVKAFQRAREFDDDVIIQELIQGNTYRVLTIDYRFAAATLLKAPFITGDGKSTIQQLINSLNEDPLRESGDKGKLGKIVIEEETLNILEINGYSLSSVLPEGSIINLKNSGNMKLGASSHDVTASVHPYNIFTCERVCRILNLNVAGIDIISNDISIPLNVNNARVIEVNAAPDFRMHLNPTSGEPRKVQEQFISMLFPADKPTHVPVISVTGSKGKTLAVKIIRHILQSRQCTVGSVCSDGIFINDNLLREISGFDPVQAGVVLKDPTVDHVVLETNVETVLQYGLGYKFADIAIILNLDENKKEYYEYDHIRDIVDIAYAKSVVAEEVMKEGYTVLNADNDLIFEMSDRLYSKPVFFTTNPLHEDVLLHIKNNGIAVILDNGKITIHAGQAANDVIYLNQVPLFNELHGSYVKDCILGAVAALFASGVTVDKLKDNFSTLRL